MDDKKAILLACAKDTGFFAKTFFPKTFRQESPPYAQRIYEVAESRDYSHCMINIYRGGSKTTQAKAILAKRIAFAVSNTQLLVSQSEGHSIRTLMWVKRQIERKEKFSKFFGLAPAKDAHTGRPVKWAENWICIHNATFSVDVHLVAVGIDGQARGLNIDDYRPDFILGDDIADDLNSGNAGPRQDVIDKWTGAIEKSLAPKSENPVAKIMLLQTPIAEGDIVDALKTDPRYAVFELGCFVNGESAWPARWSTEELLRDKDAHIKSNKLRMWMREMELQHTAKHNQLLPADWIAFSDEPVDLDTGFVVVALDPTPPPKLNSAPRPLSEKLDDAALVAIHVTKTTRTLLDVLTVKSPTTTDILASVFDFIKKWKPFKFAIETVLFARTLSYDIADAQKARGIFFPVLPIEDRRAKPIRITTELTKYCVSDVQGNAQLRPFVIRKDMTHVYQQWIGYDGNPSKHDDILDAISIAFMVADQFLPLLDTIEGSFTVLADDAPLPALTFEDMCP